jgi:retron-type reverse transcriptase
MLVERIASSLKLRSEYIELIARTASHRYKTYEIPKKTGGVRTIDHPARELKLLQSWLIENVFVKLPVHRSATAYKKRASVLRNATLHKNRNYLLKVDFEDFFHSITGRDVSQLLQRHRKAIEKTVDEDSDIELIRHLVCRRGSLTIGAPSSPIISNLVMFEFDENRSAYCRERNIIYSRYADDLYFSTNDRGVLEVLLADIRLDIAARQSPVLRINERKTVFASRKRRRLVTGLVLTPTGAVSLGRRRKRFIKSLVFKNSGGNLTGEQVVSLKGLLAYAYSIEPEFINSLRTKYGAGAIGEQPVRGS